MAKLETIIAGYFTYLHRIGSTINTVLGLLCCSLLGIADLVLPTGLDLPFLYILPIAFTTWFAGKRTGILVSVICTAFLSHNYLKFNRLVGSLDILSALGFFLVFVLMLVRLRDLLELESTLSRRDPLTGVMNQRAFSELVGYEIMRLQRESSPYSLVYLDVDNFKVVNDQFGHAKGDELLKAVASCLTDNLRKTDIVARMGGDEFTIFYPATGQEPAKVITQKIKEKLDALSEENDWPTSISMGVVTCTSGMCELEGIVTVADKLMYEVKNSGKNDVLYAMYSSTPTEKL
jgi:diguanylate cyclase (GGDEF)-like protein